MSKKTKFFIIIPLILIAAAIAIIATRPKNNSDEISEDISPAIGSIKRIISTTGLILPKNRLEIKPPVNGRIESILVKEGERVKTGQTMAIMSSTERAALLDAAQNQGPEKLKYWQQVYKPIILLAPIDGEVIVATIQPGQTVTTVDAIVVLSDQLIVRAQVDETDIGKIKLGQKAVVSIDAYPDDKIDAVTEHIYYESETVNNVTVYKADLKTEKVPAFFRSGMNATIDFIEEEKDNIMLVPLGVAHKDEQGSFVLLKNGGPDVAIRQAVVTGISDDKNIEIVSGLKPDDRILLKIKKYALPKSDIGTNPLSPFRRRQPSANK